MIDLKYSMQLGTLKTGPLEEFMFPKDFIVPLNKVLLGCCKNLASLFCCQATHPREEVELRSLHDINSSVNHAVNMVLFVQ